MSPGRTPDWTVVLPVKHLSAAKSRMGDAGLPALDSLAMAFFQDTATAALGCADVRQVVVATSDARVSEWALAAGCAVFDDRDHPGINNAASAAVSPDAGPVAVLVSDLPSATAVSLAAALGLARAHPNAFLADAAGTGTTLWARLGGVQAQPHFGLDSRAAHRGENAVDIVATLDVPDTARLECMRRDVDTLPDLLDALRLGVGAYTAAAVAGVAIG